MEKLPAPRKIHARFHCDLTLKIYKLRNKFLLYYEPDRAIGRPDYPQTHSLFGIGYTAANIADTTPTVLSSFRYSFHQVERRH